jgi:hypothetical protein
MGEPGVSRLVSVKVSESAKAGKTVSSGERDSAAVA